MAAIFQLGDIPYLETISRIIFSMFKNLGDMIYDVFYDGIFNF